ncbi:MATE efflux family protein [Fragilariopsis cylindrus CCMP1102]|uniref:MATE efflux family protein n=1 Tax=Fragilariopsis cylindrus CCMP1102 TaxID=635003 RepID=A0A1E7FUR7_9STRA|nr:MATE efflux family protein [Fragilariopsis cylindrus CCMP1102]|eukprot:OEU21900.1 MATE efflux family protein [Fragilariopsis cylindrus CCMP1102]
MECFTKAFSSISLTTTTRTTSTGRKILNLAIPALGALLIDPLLTIADTAFVGRYSESPYELAGMGSASALLIFSFYIFNFLCTATTPLVASKRATKDESGAMAVGGQALSLAFGLGAILTISLILFRQPLLDLMGATTMTNDYAMDFLMIRALSAPAVFIISASTGILRGYLDTKTPIYVLFLANIVNFGLDVVLITVLGLGPKGAAIATTTAEWISAVLFLFVLAGKIPSADGELGKKKEDFDISNNLVTNGQSDDGDDDDVNVNVATSSTTSTNTLVITPKLSIPPWNEIKPLIVASSSVFIRSLVIQLLLTSAAAFATRGDGDSDNGTAFISAHQIAIQLWMLCSYISDALAAASQGLVADAIGRKDTIDVHDISKTVFVYSAVLGLLLSGLLFVGFYSTHFLVDFFTSDTGTQNALLEIAGLIIFSQPLNSLVFAADGVLQGASEFPYQAKSMLISGFVTAIFFWTLQTTGDSDKSLLFNIWAALICLQLMRGITSAVKIFDRNGPIKLGGSPVEIKEKDII